MTCFRMPISSIGSSGNRTPRSIVYGKWIEPGLAVEDPDVDGPGRRRSRASLSPTRSYIACISICGGQPLLDLVDDRELGGPLVGLGRAGASSRRTGGRSRARRPCSARAWRGRARRPRSRRRSSRLSSPMTPITAARPGDRDAEPRLVSVPPTWIAPAVVLLLVRPDAERPARRDHRRRQPLAHRPGSRSNGTPSSRSYGHDDQVGRRIVEGDEHRPDVEHRAHPLADQVDDRLELELPGERLADLVDHRELGRSLVRLREQPLRLVEQARVLEGHAHARRHRAEQSLRGARRTRAARTPRARSRRCTRSPIEDRHAEPGLGDESALAPGAPASPRFGDDRLPRDDRAGDGAQLGRLRVESRRSGRLVRITCDVRPGPNSDRVAPVPLAVLDLVRVRRSCRSARRRSR